MALNQQAATLKQQQKTVAAEMGQLQANQISGDGVYVVGKDNIEDNNNFDGAETVDVSGAYAFQVSGRHG